MRAYQVDRSPISIFFPLLKLVIGGVQEVVGESTVVFQSLRGEWAQHDYLKVNLRESPISIE